MRNRKSVIAGLVALGLVVTLSIPAMAAPVGKLTRPPGFHAAEQPAAHRAFGQLRRESASDVAGASKNSIPPGLVRGQALSDDDVGDSAIQLASRLQSDQEPEDPAQLQAKYNAIAEHFKNLSPAPDVTAVQNLHTQEQLGFGAIVRLLSLAKATGKSYADLLAEFKAGAGWGQLAKKYGVHPGSLENPGSVFGGKGMAHAGGGPPGLAEGSPPGLAKAKAKGAARGAGSASQ